MEVFGELGKAVAVVPEELFRTALGLLGGEQVGDGLAHGKRPGNVALGVVTGGEGKGGMAPDDAALFGEEGARGRDVEPDSFEAGAGAGEVPGVVPGHAGPGMVEGVQAVGDADGFGLGLGFRAKHPPTTLAAGIVGNLPDRRAAPVGLAEVVSHASPAD